MMMFINKFFRFVLIINSKLKDREQERVQRSKSDQQRMCVYV